MTHHRSKALDLKAGDVIDFYLDKDGRAARLRARNRPIKDAFGALNNRLDPDRPSLSLADTDEVIGDAIVEDDARIMRQYREWQEFLAWRRSRRPPEAAE